MNMDTWLKQPTVPISLIKDGSTAELPTSNVRLYEFQTEYGLIRIAMAFCENNSQDGWAVYETEGKLHYARVSYYHCQLLIVGLKTFLIFGEYYAEFGFTKDGTSYFKSYEPVMLTSGLLV